MTGALWAVMAGVGFGVFQSLNRRAVSGMDVYLATFLQLLISAFVLSVATVFTVDLNLLRGLPVGAFVNFALAGFTHFFMGWTFLNMSQKRIGAARTSPLIGTTPLFAAVVAAFTLREFPDAISWAGIGMMVVGVYVVSNRSNAASGTSQITAEGATLGRGSIFGLAAAFSWAVSPIFIRAGLESVPSPLLGVTIGLIASAAAYGLPLLLRRKKIGTLAASSDAFLFKVAAGILVGLSTWVRWIALDLSAVAVVLALSMVSVPIVIVLSPLVSGKQQERVTRVLWIGAALIVGGALVLILVP